MALDAQRNWTVSMAENLEQTRMRAKKAAEMDVPTTTVPLIRSTSPVVWQTDPIHLPDEIITLILDFVREFPEAQSTLASCCLLSSQWYRAAIPMLYESPYIIGKNFDPFARAICPSINLHVRKSPLASLVKTLDMSKLVHQGSKSLTARLLGRVKNQLEVFVAPQATFNLSCLPALSKCQCLRVLDLSLISESPTLPDLFRNIAHLTNLNTFRLPRSSGFGKGFDKSALLWPPRLESITLSGGIDTHFLHGVVAFPLTLRRLTIEHCPLARGSAIAQLLRNVVRPLPRLEYLKLAHLPRLQDGDAIDDLLAILPYLKRLSISVDYISSRLFDYTSACRNERIRDEYTSSSVPAPPRDSGLGQWSTDASKTNDNTNTGIDGSAFTLPSHSHLRILELTDSGTPGSEDRISPIDLLIAIEDDQLPFLRQIWVARTLQWDQGETRREVDSLVDAMVEMASTQGVRREAGELGQEIHDDDRTEIGVWVTQG